MGIKSLYSRSVNVYPTKTPSVAKALETTMIQQTSDPLRIQVRLWSAAKAAFDIFKKNPVIRYGLQSVYASVIATGATEKNSGPSQRKWPWLFVRMSKIYSVRRLDRPEDITDTAFFTPCSQAVSVNGYLLPDHKGFTAGADIFEWQAIDEWSNEDIWKTP